MIKRSWVIGLGLVVLVWPAPQVWAQDWNALLKQVYQARAQGNITQARQLGEALLKQAEAAKQTEVTGFMLGQLGYSALTEKRYPEARQYLEQAYTLQKTQYEAADPKIIQTMLLLCDAYYQPGDYDPALTWIDRIQAIPGQQDTLGVGKVHTLLLKGAIHANRKQYDDARHALTALLALVPSVTDVNLKQQLALEQQEATRLLSRLDQFAQYQAAAAASGVMTDNRPGAAPPDDMLQLLLQSQEASRQNRFEQARPLAREALQLAEQRNILPHIVNALDGLAVIGLNSGNYAEAVDALSRILSYEDKKLLTPEALMRVRQLLAEALYRSRRFPDALVQYQALDRLMAAQAEVDPAQQKMVLTRLQELQVMDQGPDYFDLMGTPYTRWHDQTRTIRVYVKPGEKLPGWNARYAELLDEALSEWQAVLGERLTLEVVPRKRDADVRVSWQKKASPHRGGMEGAETLGLNLREVIEQQHLVRSDIDLALHDLQGRPVSEAVLKSVILHEIGHMLGLEHSNNPNDLMYVSVDPALLKEALVISDRDKATLRKLYAHRADITNPPGMPLSKAEGHVREQYYRQNAWMGNPDGMMWSPFNMR